MQVVYQQVSLAIAGAQENPPFSAKRGEGDLAKLITRPATRPARCAAASEGFGLPRPHQHTLSGTAQQENCLLKALFSPDCARIAEVMLAASPEPFGAQSGFGRRHYASLTKMARLPTFPGEPGLAISGASPGAHARRGRPPFRRSATSAVRNDRVPSLRPIRQGGQVIELCRQNLANLDATRALASKPVGVGRPSKSGTMIM